MQLSFELLHCNCFEDHHLISPCLSWLFLAGSPITQDKTGLGVWVHFNCSLLLRWLLAGTWKRGCRCTSGRLESSGNSHKALCLMPPHLRICTILHMSGCGFFHSFSCHCAMDNKFSSYGHCWGDSCIHVVGCEMESAVGRIYTCVGSFIPVALTPGGRVQRGLVSLLKGTDSVWWTK